MFKEHKKLSVYKGTTVTFTGFVPLNNVTLTFFEINQKAKLYYLGQVTIDNHTDF